MFLSNHSNKKKTVYVGVSGGVDSSVATKRLINQGYKVVGAFIKTWYPDWLPCDWKSERRDAMRVCAKLDIPFVEYDLGETYFIEVGMNMVKEYQAGHTPNPDVMCNKHVKFDVFWQAARKDGADYIATGHYAQKTTLHNYQTKNTKHELANLDRNNSLHLISKAVDHNKDQTYFLWGINPNVLPHVLLPVGNSTKDEIRKDAARSNLITANKPDSQGICFLGQVDLKEFLSHYLDLVPGKVLDTGGKVVGSHDSAYVYTIGQRHGFELDRNYTEPMFVISKDVASNQLVVGNLNELEKNTKTDEITIRQINIFKPLEVGQMLQARYRYRQDLIEVEVVELSDYYLKVKFIAPQMGIAPGQSLVLYQDDFMVSGGIIQ